MAAPIDVIVLKFREIYPTGNRRNCALGAIYLTKSKINFACLSNCRYCADRAQNLPGPAPSNVLYSAPDFIQIGSLSAKL